MHFPAEKCGFVGCMGGNRRKLQEGFRAQESRPLANFHKKKLLHCLTFSLLKKGGNLLILFKPFSSNRAGLRGGVEEACMKSQRLRLHRSCGSCSICTNPGNLCATFFCTCTGVCIPLKTLTSLNKEARPFFLGDNSIWSFPSVSSLSDYSIWRS